MPLCTYCKIVPFRKIIEVDSSLTEGSSENEYHVKSHDSIPEVIASGRSCELYKALASAITTSFWYENLKTDADLRTTVWLCFKIGTFTPAVIVYLGKNKPETQVFGKHLQVYTAFGGLIVSLSTTYMLISRGPDGPMAARLPLRYVHESPTHELSLRQIDAWLQDCNKRHGQCAHVAQQEMPLPTRVLDLNALPQREAMLDSKDWHDLFRNKECKFAKNFAGEKGQYVALSYCWGNTLAYKTTNHNRSIHMQGIGFSGLPKTLQDAIFLTRYLRLRYIWIDCLCIVQDDKADWEREAANMANIYSKSYLTIAAARASDSAEGFLGPRKIKHMDLILFEDMKGPFWLYFYAFDVSFLPGSIESVNGEPLRVG
jgi:hypothetical protein